MEYESSCKHVLRKPQLFLSVTRDVQFSGTAYRADSGAGARTCAVDGVEHELEGHAELVEQQARHVHVGARAARQRHVAGGECALLERERVRCTNVRETRAQ